MGWPLDNLGDYNDVRMDLQAFNGCKDALYKAIGDNAIAKAAPSLLVKGGLVGGAVVAGLSLTAYVANKLYKNKKKAIQEEPTLKAAFEEMVDDAVDCEAERNAEDTKEEMQSVVPSPDQPV